MRCKTLKQNLKNTSAPDLLEFLVLGGRHVKVGVDQAALLQKVADQRSLLGRVLHHDPVELRNVEERLRQAGQLCFLHQPTIRDGAEAPEPAEDAKHQGRRGLPGVRGSDDEDGGRGASGRLLRGSSGRL